MKRFSIVVPNYNGKKHLSVCLQSLKGQTFKNFEVIVVDDKSTDDSVDFIKNKYPEIILVALKKNSGFPKAANTGIKKAGGELIVLLNNDTETDKNWLFAIDAAAKKYPECGFFASKMLDFKDRDIIDTCGDGMNWSGMPYKIGSLEKDGEKFCKEKYVFGACAGASVYRKEFFDKVGYFDEDFGFYLEDIDLDFRGQLAGLKCLFVPDAKVYHIGSATAGKNSKFSFKMAFKNRHHVIYKNFPAEKLAKNIFNILYAELRCFGAALRDRYVAEYFWAIFKAFFEWPKMIPKRRQIQKNRKVSVEYLDSIIDKQYNFRPLPAAIKKWHKSRPQSS